MKIVNYKNFVSLRVPSSKIEQTLKMNLLACEQKIPIDQANSIFSNNFSLED